MKRPSAVAVSTVWWLLSMSLGALCVSVEAARPQGRVTASRLNLRRGAGVGFEVIARLPRGTEVEVLTERVSWLEVRARLSDGVEVTGWVSARYVERSKVPLRPPPTSGDEEPVGGLGTPTRPAAGRPQRLAFILDPTRSTLDMLGAKGRSWVRFEWHRNDYPGSPRGPNEASARALASALRGLCAERRVNTGATRLPFDWRRIEPELEAVPDEARYRLHRLARASFVAMRAAAQRDGVSLRLVSAARTPAQQKRLAGGNRNGAAVAQGVSAHNYGLAIDLAMSPGAATPLKEVTTRPFSNVMAMRSSPVHKWMFCFGREFGWYPYTNEPWHWEYNPEGLKARFP